MESQSWTHDWSFRLSKTILGIIGGCLREDERVDAFWEIYEACKTGITQYQLEETRLLHRMQPTQN